MLTPEQRGDALKMLPGVGAGAPVGVTASLFRSGAIIFKPESRRISIKAIGGTGMSVSYSGPRGRPCFPVRAVARGGWSGSGGGRLLSPGKLGPTPPWRTTSTISTRASASSHPRKVHPSAAERGAFGRLLRGVRRPVELTVKPVTLALRLRAPIPVVKPYAVAGGGAYFSKLETKGAGSEERHVVRSISRGGGWTSRCWCCS